MTANPSPSDEELVEQNDPATIDLMQALADSLGKAKPPAYCRDCGTYLDGGMIARSKDNPRLCVECANE